MRAEGGGVAREEREHERGGVVRKGRGGMRGEGLRERGGVAREERGCLLLSSTAPAKAGRGAARGSVGRRQRWDRRGGVNGAGARQLALCRSGCRCGALAGGVVRYGAVCCGVVRCSWCCSRRWLWNRGASARRVQ